MLFLFSISIFSKEGKDEDTLSDPNARVTSEKCQEDVVVTIGFGTTSKKCEGPIFISDKTGKKFCGKCQHIIKEKPPP